MDAENNDSQSLDSLDSSLEGNEKIVSPQQPLRPDRFVMRFNRSAVWITIATLVIILMITGASFGITALLANKQPTTQNSSQSSTNYSVGSLPVENLKPFTQLQVGEA